jgi:hypothetical protein
MGHDVDGHKNMHVDQGALPGEHPGKATDPIIKVRDIAWLEFRKPDLAKAEANERGSSAQRSLPPRTPTSFASPMPRGSACTGCPTLSAASPSL